MNHATLQPGVPRNPLTMYRRHVLVLALSAMIGSLGCGATLSDGRLIVPLDGPNPRHAVIQSASNENSSSNEFEVPPLPSKPESEQRSILVTIVLPPGSDVPDTVDARPTRHDAPEGKDRAGLVRTKSTGVLGGNTSTWKWVPERSLDKGGAFDLELQSERSAKKVVKKGQAAPFGAEMQNEVIVRVSADEMPHDWPKPSPIPAPKVASGLPSVL